MLLESCFRVLKVDFKERFGIFFEVNEGTVFNSKKVWLYDFQGGLFISKNTALSHIWIIVVSPGLNLWNYRLIPSAKNFLFRIWSFHSWRTAISASWKITRTIKSAKLHIIARMVVASIHWNLSFILAVYDNLNKFLNAFLYILELLFINLNFPKVINRRGSLDIGFSWRFVQKLDQSRNVVFRLELLFILLNFGYKIVEGSEFISGLPFFFIFLIEESISNNFHLLVHFCEHFVNNLKHFFMSCVQFSSMRLQILLNIPSARAEVFINFLLGVVFHFGKLLDTFGLRCNDVLDFGWFLCFLVKLNMVSDTLWTQWLNAIGSLTDVGDWVLLMGGTRYGDETRSIGWVDRAHLTPTAPGRRNFRFKHLILNF